MAQPHCIYCSFGPAVVCWRPVRHAIDGPNPSPYRHAERDPQQPVWLILLVLFVTGRYFLRQLSVSIPLVLCVLDLCQEEVDDDNDVDTLEDDDDDDD